jgi:phage shock protein PspC (stress-responsive transcriptional regulator)
MDELQVYIILIVVVVLVIFMMVVVYIIAWKLREKIKGIFKA